MEAGDAFDFCEVFPADAALDAEGVADVEAAAEIDALLENTETPEKVAAWLDANLAKMEVEMEMAKSPGSTVARGGVAGERKYGGLSARVLLLHRNLLRERQRSNSLEQLYLKAMAQARAARETKAEEAKENAAPGAKRARRAAAAPKPAAEPAVAARRLTRNRD